MVDLSGMESKSKEIDDKAKKAKPLLDKSWYSADRRTKRYEDGVEVFLNHVKKNLSDPSSIQCPCIKCGNMKVHDITVVKDHLFCYGIDSSYDVWIWHGENICNVEEDKCTLDAEECCLQYNDDINAVEMVEAAKDIFECNPEKFVDLLDDAERPLYTGCSGFTKLSVLVRLYNFKTKYGWSDASFNELLSFWGDVLPKGNLMPTSIYEAKKTLCALGMQYEKIHACPNDCILYRNANKNVDVCPNCSESRWKIPKGSNHPKVGMPAKVVWYFPPIPRFRRMYGTRQISKDLIWHSSEREVDSYIRHPADAASWKLIDHKWPDFGCEPRNLRLALAADGINPHSSLSSRHSTWPVVLITYNLPPWLCMKRKFMMLTLLISGPKQPGNDIDIFLQPLIDDLKMLWDVGVKIYDAYLQEVFTLKAVLLWTINDFPAYGNLSGCSVKGYLACPICAKNTQSVYLKHSRKNVYQGHRRFLHRNHPYRRAQKAFNGCQEYDVEPKPLTET